MKFEILNKFTKNQKIIGIMIIFLFVGAIGFNLLKGSFASSDPGFLRNQTVENLEFNNASLVFENNVSTFSVEVMNALDEDDYNLSTIEIIFKDSEGKEIENLLGYIGNSLEPKEVKILEASVDKEIANVSSIEYIINK